MTESYEQLKAQATGEGADAWMRADCDDEGRPRALYDSVRQDLRWSEEHKAEEAWSTYWGVDHRLVWDHEREARVDGHAYDGSRFGIGSGRPRAA